MIKVIMDSAGDLPHKLRKALDIRIVPVNISFGDRTYLDKVNIDDETFYARVAAEKSLPKTSQPSPHQFAEVYRQVAREAGVGDIISINVSSQLSGTHASSLLAAAEVADVIRVHPFDSRSGSGGQGLMCLEAARMAVSGWDVEAILGQLCHIRDQMNILLMLDNLRFAQMSGRVGAMAATISSLLRIKPLIHVRDGMMEVKENVRTQSRALDRMVDLVREQVGDRLADMAVIHAQAPQLASDLLSRVEKEFNIREIFVERLSLGVAVHLGPGTVGLVSHPVE
jgi:DegV family protein with EDD domain